MFLTYEGNEITVSHAAKAIKNSIERAGVLKDFSRKATATVIRKLVATLVREDEPELAGPLAQQLCHSSKTAEGTYQLKMSQKSLAKVVQAIDRSVSSAANTEKQQGVKVMDESEATITNSSPPQTNNTAYHIEQVPPANAVESNTEFCLPSKADFVNRLATFSDPNNVNSLIAQATELYAERRENRWGCYVDGSRYRIVADFDDCVKKTYCIELSAIIKNAVPNISDDRELQSDAMIIFASEFANLFLKSSTHLTSLISQNVETTVESDPQADQLSATKKKRRSQS